MCAYGCGCERCLTKQMLVSGMISDNETTSSFPDRLPEWSPLNSAPMLSQKKQKTVDRRNDKQNIHNITCRKVVAVWGTMETSTAPVPVRSTLVVFCVCRFVHLHPNRPATSWGNIKISKQTTQGQPAPSMLRVK